MAKKYLDENGLLYLWQKIKAKFISDITYNSTSKKIQKTQNGTTSDVVTLSKVATSNSYNDLDNKPTIPSAVQPTTTTPKMDGTANVGSETKYAKGDHVHPSDTTKVDKVSGKGLSTNDYTDGDKAKVDAITEELLAGGKVHYGECSTDAATTAKTVTTTDGSYELKTGSAIFVKFTVTNTGSTVYLTLDVDGTGAKPIKYRGSALPTTGTLSENRLYSFIYDGTNYNLLGDLDTDTTYTNVRLGQGYGTCSSLESTTEKVVTLTGYTLATGGVVAVWFSKAVPANSTMNINNKGAKSIYYKGEAITSGVIHAKDVATFIYDGTRYELLTVNTVFTPSEKTKLSGIASGAEVNVQADWNETNSSSDAYIKNKPTIPSGVEVDDELSSTSINPVQNKVINNALPFRAVVGETDFQTIYDAFVANRFIYGAESEDDNYWFFMTPDLGGPNPTFYFARIEDFGAHINIGYMSVDDTNGWQYRNSYDLISIDDTVTTTNNGLMLSTDKVKLNKLLFDSNNLIDSSILPSYVDDVIEAYPRSGQTPLSQNWLATGSASGTVITPEAGKIYVLMADSGDYTTNTQFRWSGTTYVKLNDGGVTSITNAEIDTIIAS